MFATDEATIVQITVTIAIAIPIMFDSIVIQWRQRNPSNNSVHIQIFSFAD